MKKIYLVLLLLLIKLVVFAQETASPFAGQSIFEDKNGNSAIFLPGGGTFRINTADASLKFSFVRQVSDKKLFYGFDVSGKTNDGLLPLISKGDISPGTKVNGILGLKELVKSPSLDGWLALKVGYEGSSFKLFDPTVAFGSQVLKKTFNTFTSSLSFNFKIGGNNLLALSAGYQKVNNYKELDEIELKDEWATTNPANTVTRSFESKTKVRKGAYETFDQVPLNLDYFWFFADHSRIGMYHFVRSKFNNGKLTNGVGSGIYLLKKDQPLSAVLGMVVEVNDLSKLKEGYGKNFTVSFTVAHNFSLAK